MLRAIMLIHFAKQRGVEHPLWGIELIRVLLHFKLLIPTCPQALAVDFVDCGFLRGGEHICVPHSAVGVWDGCGGVALPLTRSGAPGGVMGGVDGEDGGHCGVHCVVGEFAHLYYRIICPFRAVLEGIMP